MKMPVLEAILLADALQRMRRDLEHRLQPNHDGHQTIFSDPMKFWFNPITSVSRRPEAAVRDDIATTAHYIGRDIKPAVAAVEPEPPKAKPALAGLSMTAAEGRFKGLGFSDA